MLSITRYRALPSGRLAYDHTGASPLIVMTPAMLGVRAELCFIASRLVAGFQVVTIDQRGMGASGVAWRDAAAEARWIVARRGLSCCSTVPATTATLSPPMTLPRP